MKTKANVIAYWLLNTKIIENQKFTITTIHVFQSLKLT